MPHLAPLNWLTLPAILLISLYLQMILFYFNTPTTFPKLPTPTFSPAHWLWSYLCVALRPIFNMMTLHPMKH